MKYTIKVEFIHWVEVEADSDDDAFEEAYNSLPTFTSGLDDVSMDIMSKEENK